VPVPDVVVELAPADAGSPHAAVLLAACSVAVPGGRCELAGEGPEHDPPRAVAIVTWDGPDRRVAHVEVGVRRDGRGEWIARDLRFAPGDDPVEIWRSVGLAIATLAGEVPRRRGSERASPPALPSVAAPAVPNAHARGGAGREGSGGRATLAVRPVAWMDLGFVAGPGLDQGPWRAGGSLVGAYAPGRGPWYGFLGGRYAARPSDEREVTIRWASAFAGVGGSARVGTDVYVEADLGPTVEVVGASAMEGMTGRTDSGTNWAAGARAGARAWWATSPSIGAIMGADASWMARGTTVHVRGEEIGRTPAVAWTVVAGVRFAF
jgi:hypothetical protein